jgi:endonuclease-3 related protein
MDVSVLAEIIRPAGFFNQKAAYLKTVTEWYAGYDFDISTVQKEPLEKLRTELLGVRVVGRETADSILLYAFGFPTFVVDAYTVRLCERLPIDAGKGYEAVKAHFEGNIPRNSKTYNNYHALIVINGKNHCRRKPLCNGCPLVEMCGRCGL